MKEVVVVCQREVVEWAGTLSGMINAAVGEDAVHVEVVDSDDVGGIKEPPDAVFFTSIRGGGLEMAERFQQEHPDCRVFALTAHPRYIDEKPAPPFHPGEVMMVSKALLDMDFLRALLGD